MKCIEHSEKDAVGVCKNCYRGVCRDCFEYVGRSIACTDETCVAAVKVIDEILNRSRKSFSATASAFGRNAVIYFALSLTFLIVTAVLRTSTSTLIFLPMGLVMLVAAIYQVKTARDFGRK